MSSQFQNGTRVYATQDIPMPGSGIGVLPKGTTGTVVDGGIFGTQSGIEWDINIGGHGCDGNCEYGFGWYVQDEYLSPIDQSGIDAEYEALPIDSLLSGYSIHT